MRTTNVLVIGLIAACPVAATPATPAPASPAQLQAAIDASAKPRGQTTWWRSDATGLIFGYDQRWAEVPASQQHTVVVVNWTARQGGGLMATCYIESTANSEIARLSPTQVEARAESIAAAFMRNGKKRDPNMRMLTWRLARQDNHPVVYVERDFQIATIDKVAVARSYSIITAWKGREVVLECASDVPRRFPEMAPVVEAPIRRVLNSLQFVREPG